MYLKRVCWVALIITTKLLPEWQYQNCFCQLSFIEQQTQEKRTPYEVKIPEVR